MLYVPFFDKTILYLGIDSVGTLLLADDVIRGWLSIVVDCWHVGVDNMGHDLVV